MEQMKSSQVQAIKSTNVRAGLVFLAVLVLGAYVPRMWHASAKYLSSTGDKITLWWIASDISSKGIYSDPKSLTRTQDQDVTKEDALKAYWVASLKLNQALDQIDSVRIAVQE